MKKLLLILTIGLIGFGSALSLEPINITFKASPSYGANTTINDVYITLSDKTGIKFTSQERDGVLIDDSGIITIKVGLFNATEQAAWDAITANSINSFTVLEARIGGPTAAPFTQVRIDAQIINQTSTSVFINGNLVPQNPTSTLGTDNERFAGAYVLGSSVHIGAAGGELANSELKFGYVDSNGVNSGYGYGTVTVNGDPSARFYDNRVSLEGNSLVNSPWINNAGGITINGDDHAAITLAGAVTANRAGNVIGNTTDAAQLTINGVNTPASPGPYIFDFVVNGDAKVAGYLEINGLSLQGDLDMNNYNIFDVNEIRGRDPLQSDPFTLRINETNDGNVIFGDGDVSVGNGNTSFGTGTFTKGTGQSTFNGNVDAALGLDVTGADLTVATPALFSVNGSTGVLTSTAAGNTINSGADVTQLTITGTPNTANYELVVDGDADILGDLHVDYQITAPAAAHTLGTAGTNATVLTVSGLVGGANELVVNGDANITGNTTLDGNIVMGTDAADDINVLGEFISDLIPNANNQYNLGSTTQRWKSLYLNATSLHLGDAANDELHVTYDGTNTANFAVNGTNPQFSISSAGTTSIDPAADGQSNFVFTEGLMSVNTGGGTNLVLNEDGFVKTAGGDTEFSFTNPGAGNLNVTIDGDLDVAEQITAPNVGHSFGTSTDATVVTINGDVAGAAYELVVNGDADILGDVHIDETLNVTGTANVDGVFTATTFGNSIGNNSDNTQLTINGQVGGAYDFIVTGDGNTTGSFDVDGILNVDTYITNTTGTDPVQVNDNLLVTGTSNLVGAVTADATLDVDGNTTLNANTTLGDALASDLTTFNSKVNSDIIANTSTFGLGTNAERWGHAYVLGNSVHVGPANGEGATELKIGYAANAATFNVDGATQAQLQINALSDNVVINPDGTGTNSYSFRTNGLEIDNGVGTTNLILSESGISRNSVSNETFTFVNPDVTSTLNVIVEGTSNLQGNVDANNGVDVTGAALTVGSPALFSVNGTSGVLTSTAAGNSIGATTDATQLTINGVVGGANDFVVTGDAQTTGNVAVGTDLTVTGNSVFNGNTTLGSDVADDVAINGQVTTNINPDVDNTLDLGTPALRWKDINLGGNASVGGQLIFPTTTNSITFDAPAAATAITYTLPATGPANNGEALISTTGGVMSWGGVSLQTAYVAGNSITTVGAEGNVIIGGDQRLDVQIDIENSTVATPVRINDPQGLLVVGGVISGNNGLTITAGASSFSGGVGITGGAFNMSSSGQFDIQSTVTVSNLASPQTNISGADINLTGANTEITGNTITVGNNASAARLTLATPPSFKTGTAIGDYANIITINFNGTTNLNTSSFSANHQVGAVVYLYCNDTGVNSSLTFTSNNGNDVHNFVGSTGFTIVKADDGFWKVVGSNN